MNKNEEKSTFSRNIIFLTADPNTDKVSYQFIFICVIFSILT